MYSSSKQYYDIDISWSDKNPNLQRRSGKEKRAARSIRHTLNEIASIQIFDVS